MGLNIVIPMAGAGSRFAKMGYKDPKPFIPVDGKFMISHVIDNINIPGAKYIFICQKEHLKEYGGAFVQYLKDKTFIKDFEILGIDGLTEGAAVTVLKAREFIDNNDELLVVNSDQLLGSDDILRAVSSFEKDGADGGIICFFNKSQKWSYVEINDRRLITRIAEKQPISEHATVGVYWFRKGSKFTECASAMIQKNDRVNGEFYLAPVYNYLIMEEGKISPYFINSFHGLGTPEDLDKFLELS